MDDCDPQKIIELSAVDARNYFCRSASYFDMEMPAYFNFAPLIERCANAASEIGYEDLMRWRPDRFTSLNYTLLHNKDGLIGWRPFELMNPLIYGMCVHLITEKSSWARIQARFDLFSDGVVECCSLPVVSVEERKSKAEQIISWWRTVEQRSLELSMEYSHVTLTDVSNCYPSIYTHAISWALYDRDFAKDAKIRQDGNLFGNRLDKLICSSREGQTNGIPQASSLSHVIAEIILGYCDTYIASEIGSNPRVRILRYRDDYRIFGHSDYDCGSALRVVSRCLNEFGMRLGQSKTSNSMNVVVGAVKQDKIDALEVSLDQKTLQKSLLLIHRFGLESPGSGALKNLLSEFLFSLRRRIKKKTFDRENATILVAILLDIASTSPNIFPAVATAISEVLIAVDRKTTEKIFELVLKRVGRIANSEYMEIWLQRIAHPNGLNFESASPVCKLLSDKPQSLWSFDWVQDKGLRKELTSFSIVDKGQLGDVPSKIDDEEFDAFWSDRNGLS